MSSFIWEGSNKLGVPPPKYIVSIWDYLRMLLFEFLFVLA